MNFLFFVPSRVPGGDLVAEANHGTDDMHVSKGRDTMRKLLYSVVAAAVMTAGASHAREPGIPTMVPTGGIVGVPAGANPPPGIYYLNRNEFFDAAVYGGSTKTPIRLKVRSSANQLHFVPGNTLFGGSYRAMVTVPFVNVSRSGVGPKSSEFGVGDIIISPLNVSWMLQPGIFVQSGLSFSLPTGSFSAAPTAINLGTNAYAASAEIGFSYLRKGWNLTAHATYFTHGENPDTNYTSGDELFVSWTALKDIGGLSIGPVGYFRKQVSSDSTKGLAYGGATFGKAEQYGAGIGVTKRFGPVEVNVNYIHDYHIRDTSGGDKLLVNFTVPLSKL